MVDGWRLIVAHTVLFAARLSLSSAESNITDIIQLLGPRTAVDVVGLLDRSQGVSRHNFYYYIQPFFHDLLSQYATIHRDFARSAVVTFARDVTVAYDTVSGSDAAAAGVSKCELFEASPSLYDRVEFVTDPSIIRGTNITGAMQRAIDILEHGRANRPNVIQVIVLVSDGDHDNDEDPFNERLILKSRGVTIFSVGVGSWLREGVMRHLATIPGYYDQFENWKNLLHAQPTNIPPGTAPLLVELDASFCGNNTCAEAGTRCYCDVDTADHRCLCAPGYHLPSTDASAVCQPCPKNSFKDTPGSGPCLECPPDRVTSHNGSTSRRDCHCDNTSCAADPCVNSSCPFGEHCVALNGLNTTCASNCPYSNCTRDFDVDTNPDVDPCADWNPCQNEGTCYKDPRGKRACKCRFNFEGKFCTPIDMCAKFRPCNEEGTVRCVAEIGSFKCICLYGRHGEFCQDINPDPPFTGSTVNETLNATSSPIVDSTSNSTNASLAEPSTKLSGSIVAAIVVCVLIGFIAIVAAVVIVVVVLLRRRRQRQKDAEAAAQKIVGPSTKPAQPTHNGTWSSGTFRGLWKDQTWRNAPEDELPLSDRPDGQSSTPKTRGKRSNGYYQNYLSEEITLKNEQLKTGRSMEDWRQYLVQLETAGIIYGGILVRPISSGSGHVKTNGWTHDANELIAIRKEMTVPKTDTKLPALAGDTRFIEVQGEQFVVRPNEGASGGGGKATLVGVCKAARTSVAAALAVDNSLVVAIGALSAGDMASARCIREVQWIAQMCGPG